jgi:hypothetical protein
MLVSLLSIKPHVTYCFILSSSQDWHKMASWLPVTCNETVRLSPPRSHKALQQIFQSYLVVYKQYNIYIRFCRALTLLLWILSVHYFSRFSCLFPATICKVFNVELQLWISREVSIWWFAVAILARNYGTSPHNFLHVRSNGVKQMCYWIYIKNQRDTTWQ